MNKLLLTLSVSLVPLLGFSQSKLWIKTSEDKIGIIEKFERAAHPSKYELFTLNFSQLKNVLANAPLDTSGIVSNTTVSFPDYTGKLADYVIYEAPVMEKGLSDKYPDIKSYVGKGIDDKSATIRFSTSMFGLHVMMTSGEAGTYYIDTYTKDLNNYIIYSRKDISSNRTFTCHVEDAAEAIATETVSTLQRASDSRFRQYRLAMACTTEYATFHINASPQVEVTDAEKKATVLAAMNTTMTRVNGVFERDMSLRMNLVANNDLIIFVNTDNFSNDDANLLIGQSQTVIDANIGNTNYDIGHTVSTGGGGLAQKPSVCIAGKARGITGSPSPVGDPYDIDFVAHEIGHQFGGSHTFNGVGGNCTSGGPGTSRSAATAVEPGSGSTIMAYAGICTGINVQENSDAYFHAISIGEMVAHITGVGNCVAGTLNSNSAPVVNAGANYTIPRGTPFALTGSATDANGDALTYCWEQTNAGTTTATATATSTTGPNFRSFNPSLSPTRYFPSMPLILTGNLTSTWEVIPNVARTMNFALTVRDNHTPNGGQTQRGNMSVTFDATRGPLTVTSQNTEGIVWTPGSTQNITWTVNNTNTSAGGATVDILLSTDNGATFSTVLLANTINDGNETITVPNVSAANCRVMVKARGNIFFNVNLKNIAIGNYIYQSQNVCNDYPFNLNSAITESTGTSYPGFNLTVPDSFTISDANFYANITHPNIGQVNILLMAPWQTALNTGLWFNNTSCTGANMNKWFDVSGSAVNCATTNDGNFASAFTPFSSANIAAFNGNNSAGSWGLYFKDTVVDSNIATARFNSFTIQLCYAQLVPVLSTENFGLENFSIYPNPNNGNFTIQFNSNSSNHIKIGVHDLRGRLVFENSYQNTGAFNQNFELNNVQSGIYIVTVQDGERKEIKKIVIN